MKIKLFLLFLFISAVAIPAQNIKFAVITDIHIGYTDADKDLDSVVSSINRLDNLKFTAVTGDITEKGKNAELNKAKKILDKLTVPYYIIPGNHDTKWSESGCTKFIDLWGDDKFFFTLDSSAFIGLNSGIRWRGGGGHIAPEDIKWLDATLKKIPSGFDIYFYIHHPLKEDIDNWFKLTNLLRNYNIQTIFYGHGHKNKTNNYNGIPAVMCRSSLHKDQKSWGYTLVEIDEKNIKLFEVNKDGTSKRWGKIKKDNNRKIPFIDFENFKAYSAVVKWQYDLDATMPRTLTVWNNKIYTVSKSGSENSTITCIDTSGKITWQYEEYGTIMSRPAVSNGVLILGTIQGDLYTVDAATGNAIQSIGFDDAITSQLLVINYKGSKTLMVPKQTNSAASIILGTSGGKLYCYDLETLEEIWSNSSASGMIETKPMYYQNKIVYGSWDGYLYCIDARDGGLIWKWSARKNFYYSPAACVPVTNGKNVFITTPQKKVFAIDLLLGTTVWANDKLNSWESIGISKLKNRIFIKSMKDKFHIISAKTGNWVKELNLKFGTDTMPVTPIEWKGNVIFGGKNGYIYLITKKFKVKKLLFLGASRVHTVIHLSGNNFAVSNMDGKIVQFSLPGD